MWAFLQGKNKQLIENMRHSIENLLGVQFTIYKVYRNGSL